LGLQFVAWDPRRSLGVIWAFFDQPSQKERLGCFALMYQRITKLSRCSGCVAGLHGSRDERPDELGELRERSFRGVRVPDALERRFVRQLLQEKICHPTLID